MGRDRTWSRAGFGVEARTSPSRRFDAGVPLIRRFTATFVQATFDGAISFRPSARNRCGSRGTRCHDARGATPRQRWAYVGGPGTTPTIDLLALGGDQLIYFDGRYSIPIERWKVPLLGAPRSLRCAMPSAAPRRPLPDARIRRPASACRQPRLCRIPRSTRRRRHDSRRRSASRFDALSRARPFAPPQRSRSTFQDVIFAAVSALAHPFPERHA